MSRLPTRNTTSSTSAASAVESRRGSAQRLPPAACAAAAAGSETVRRTCPARHRASTLRGRVVEPHGVHRRHASTVRPLSANRPCGRFWMNRMMNTSTAIFASTAPDHASRNLLTMPRPSAAVHRSGELADAAQHDDHERIDDVALAEIGTDVADLRQRAAGESRNARAKPEREHVDARRRHAERARPSSGSA